MNIYEQFQVAASAAASALKQYAPDHPHLQEFLQWQEAYCAGRLSGAPKRLRLRFKHPGYLPSMGEGPGSPADYASVAAHDAAYAAWLYGRRTFDAQLASKEYAKNALFWAQAAEHYAAHPEARYEASWLYHNVHSEWAAWRRAGVWLAHVARQLADTGVTPGQAASCPLPIAPNTCTDTWGAEVFYGRYTPDEVAAAVGATC